MAAGMEKLNFYLIFEKMSFIYFIFGCAGLSLVGVGAALVAGHRLLLLRSMGFRHAGFSSCGSWAQLLRGMQHLPGPGTESVPFIGRRTLNHWTSREVLDLI